MLARRLNALTPIVLRFKWNLMGHAIKFPLACRSEGPPRRLQGGPRRPKKAWGLDPVPGPRKLLPLHKNVVPVHVADEVPAKICYAGKIATVLLLCRGFAITCNQVPRDVQLASGGAIWNRAYGEY